MKNSYSDSIMMSQTPGKVYLYFYSVVNYVTYYKNKKTPFPAYHGKNMWTYYGNERHREQWTEKHICFHHKSKVYGQFLKIGRDEYDTD